MANSQLDAGFGRREMFGLAGAAGLALWAESQALAADFWNKSKPTEWTDQEKQELRTKSPWAKKVDAEMAARGGGPGGGDGGDDSGKGGGKKGGGGGGGKSVAPQGNFGGDQIPWLEIVWQSAKPLLEAHPLALPAKLNNHYVISVTGIPANVINMMMSGGGGRRGGGDPAPTEGAAPPDPTAGLKRGTTLSVKGKNSQMADLVMSMNEGATILFGFAKDALPLTAADNAEFSLKLGTLSAKTKFSLKDMMYNGELAI